MCPVSHHNKDSAPIAANAVRIDASRVLIMDYVDGGAAEPVERVLVVTAHPDDLDFGAAGTIATWTKAGTQVSYCIATAGDSGQQGTVPRDQVAPHRMAEQRAAGEVVGVHDVTFLGYPDSRVEVSLGLRRDIARQIRRVRPDRVLTWSPTRNWDRIAHNHPDHLAVGEATMCAVYPDAANPYIHPELYKSEGYAAWRASEVWLIATPELTTYVDVTDTFDLKVAALQAHASQTSARPDLADRLRAQLAANAALVGLPDGRLAELFRTFRTGRE
jgi:LmbE family N-acetylglucosaminyl deacetylase